MLTNQQPDFTYEALSPERDSFRLLQLEPAGKDDSQIQAELHLAHVSSSMGQYAALSYCWGEPGDIIPVVVDGYPLLVQQNLYAFLLQLRNHGHLLIWVDAICIDQNNFDERSRQVQLMSSIFPNASQVLVWLGPPTGYGGEEAFAFLEYIEQQKGGSIDPYRVHKVYRGLFSDPQEWNLWHALDDLCHRAYWSRIWIVQECLLARQLTLFCGSRYLSWAAFKYACAGPLGMKAIPGLSQSNTNEIHQIKLRIADSQFRELDKQRGLDQKRPLCTLIQTYGSSQCRDPRDRVYGLLGLCIDHRHIDDSQKLKPDYTLTSAELFWVVRRFMLRDADLTSTEVSRLLIRILELNSKDNGLWPLFDISSRKELDRSTVPDEKLTPSGVPYQGLAFHLQFANELIHLGAQKKIPWEPQRPPHLVVEYLGHVGSISPFVDFPSLPKDRLFRRSEKDELNRIKIGPDTHGLTGHNFDIQPGDLVYHLTLTNSIGVVFRPRQANRSQPSPEYIGWTVLYPADKGLQALQKTPLFTINFSAGLGDAEGTFFGAESTRLEDKATDVKTGERYKLWVTESDLIWATTFAQSTIIEQEPSKSAPLERLSKSSRTGPRHGFGFGARRGVK